MGSDRTWCNPRNEVLYRKYESYGGDLAEIAEAMAGDSSLNGMMGEGDVLGVATPKIILGEKGAEQIISYSRFTKRFGITDKKRSGSRRTSDLGAGEVGLQFGGLRGAGAKLKQAVLDYIVEVDVRQARK